MKLLLLTVAVVVLAVLPAVGRGGFDQYGYNYGARLFSGPADGVDRILGNDAVYGNDHLVMKWSKGWDSARFGGAAWGHVAWCTNHWNGRVPGGSGETWHYLIVWVGTELEVSPYWREGGYPIWGQFEVIFSHGTSPDGHFWEAHATPTGLGF